MGKKIEILPGTVFGEWTVLGEDSVRRANSGGGTKVYYSVKCSCGIEKSIYGANLRRGLSTKCMGCSRGVLFENMGDLSSSYFASVIRSAHNRGLPFTLSPQEALDQWLSQRGMCALTGWGITLGKAKDSSATASLDRINSSLGYSADNIQWLHKDINRLKNNYTEERFFEMCNAITAYKSETVKLREGSRPWVRKESSE